MNESIRKKFIKDYSLPIPLIKDESDFNYFMDLYDSVYDCKRNYKLLIDAVAQCGGESEFFTASNKFVDNVVNAIISTESYQVMNSMKKVIDYTPNNQLTNRSIYHSDFNMKELISVDIKSANFYSLYSFDASCVLGCESYPELARKFTDLEYLINSKSLRQVIFGKTNPGKLQQIQKATIMMICDNILDEYPDMKVSSTSSDELIVHDFGEYSPLEAFALVNKAIPIHVNEYIKSEMFTLQMLHIEKPFFVKIPWNISVESVIDSDEIINVTPLGYGTPIFKNIPKDFFPQAFKHYFGISLTNRDLTFMYEGIPARFIKSIYEEN